MKFFSVLSFLRRRRTYTDSTQYVLCTWTERVSFTGRAYGLEEYWTIIVFVAKRLIRILTTYLSVNLSDPATAYTYCGSWKTYGDLSANVLSQVIGIRYKIPRIERTRTVEIVFRFQHRETYIRHTRPRCPNRSANLTKYMRISHIDLL